MLQQHAAYKPATFRQTGGGRKAAGFCYLSWVHCYRCNNAPHVELLAAATEQMKITELRLHKLIASQQQQAASQSDASMAAERRAGLVFNHLMGACSLCHGINSQTISIKLNLMQATISSSICMSDVNFAACRWCTDDAFSDHNTCAGHQHGQASTRCEAVPARTLQAFPHITAQGASSMASILCL